tara:strand:- start:201 stop:653 length:453 start_codon:yes stop_codon:yes gene_type:complete
VEQQLIQQAWLDSPSTRLNRWRGFRKGLNTDDTKAVCETVVDWWKMAPISSWTIDPVDSSTWPTPWEMLHSGNFCDNSIALGMSYTIHYANEHIPNRLLYVTDRENSIQKLCTLIDNKYLLNYSYGTISTLPTENVNISFDQNISDVIKN